MSSKTHHYTLYGSTFGSNYSGRNYLFECDLAAAHYALPPLTPSGNRAYRALAARQNPPKWFPNMFHRQLLGYNQARNVPKRLDRPEWTAAYVGNSLSHWIIRHGGAANIILAPPSARAPRCLLCSFVSRAIMVCDTLRVGDSNDILRVPMLRLELKL